MSQLAPIILFTYNRPEHTRITLEYLQRNVLADQSTLYIFCDGAKEGASENVLKRIAEVKEVIRAQKWTKNVHIIESEKNKGLATNVIEGVTKIVNQYGRAIVIEDDLRIGVNFLEYMNSALEKYENIDRVKQVSGFIMPFKQENKNCSFFMPISNTIGWGTWKKKWNEIDFTAQGSERLKTDKAFRKKFNFDGTYNFTKMLLEQTEKKKNDSWAIFYWWSNFSKNGLTLYPDYPQIQHNDFDHTGTHASDYSLLDMRDWNENYKVLNFPDEIASNETAFSSHKKYIKVNHKITLKKIFIKLGLRDFVKKK